MSDKVGYNSWVPSLSDAASLTGAELLALVQSSATVKVSLSTLATYFGGGGSVGLPAVLGIDATTGNIPITSPDLSSSISILDATNPSAGVTLTSTNNITLNSSTVVAVNSPLETQSIIGIGGGFSITDNSAGNLTIWEQGPSSLSLCAGSSANLQINSTGASNDIVGTGTSIGFSALTGITVTGSLTLGSSSVGIYSTSKIVLSTPQLQFNNAAFTASTLGYLDASKNFTSLGIGSGLSIVGGDLVASGSGGTVTSISGVAANGFTWSIANATTTPAITLTLQNATTSQSGQLTATDWNTFNNKLSTATAASTYAPINNPTFTGTVTLAQDAASNLQAVTLQQLNNAILGQDYKVACKYVTIATLPTYVYNNGSSGVGATITGVSFGAITFDGVTPSVGDRVLVVDEVGGNAPYNGAYTVTIVGTGASVFVLTRTADFNTPAEINGGDAFFISLGNTKAASTYVYNGVSTPTIGTSNIIFTQTQGQGVYSAGTGLTLSLNTFAIDTSVVATLTGSQALTNKTYNGMTITSNSGTFAVGNAKSAIISNTLTFTGTDGSSVAFGTGGTVAYTNVATLSSLTSIGTLTGLTVTNAPTFSFATAGSVLFTDTAGLQAQDNNNLFWSKANHILSVNCNGDTTGADSINVYKQIDSFCLNTSDNGYSVSNARGSIGSLTQNVDGDYIGLFGFYPYNGSAWAEYASMRSYVKGTTSTNRGADLEFYTKKDGGALTLAMTIDNGQNLILANPLGIAYGGMDTRTYYSLMTASGALTASLTANTFFLGYGTTLTNNTSNNAASAQVPMMIYINSSDYPTVNGLTPKLRINAVIGVNGATATNVFTVGLYPLTTPASSGGTNIREWTIGTVVTGSDGATITNPASNSQNNIVGSDFALPANGLYCICVKSTATTAAGSYIQVSVSLQFHNA